MTPTRVYVVKGDESGWAIDEDRRLTIAALSAGNDPVEIVDDVANADVVHAVWWEPLMELPPEAVIGKRVICHFEGDPQQRLGMPGFASAMQRVDHWIAQSRAAHRFLHHLGVECSFVPYAVADACFAQRSEPAGEIVKRAIASLPADSYVVVNFYRDTIGDGLAAGRVEPKRVKGPDVFAEVLGLCRRRGLPVVALLAGPRRHWLRRRLDVLGVPWVFAGEIVEGDDYPHNILPAQQLAYLYQAGHLHLCCSRQEGGPRGVLEAAAMGVPQLSTPVGIVPDILPAECLFTDTVDAADRIERDIESGVIRRFVPAVRELARARHTVAANTPRWRMAYAEALAPGAQPRPRARAAPSLRERPRRVSFWGAGDRFMRALKAACEREGIEVTRDGAGDPAAAHLLDGCRFDVELFERVMQEQAARQPRVVQRIGGPTALLRPTPDLLRLDRLCFDLNRRYAHATVVPSAFALGALAEAGHAPVRPVIVHNAADPVVFARPDHLPPVPSDGERLRVVTSARSDNPERGAAVCEWLDRHADHDRFEFTLVGRTGAALTRWRVIDAQPPEAIAELYRDHHVYLAAGRDDPCSNALVEAQACGLPAVYLRSGGHPEVVHYGGLGFGTPAQLPATLERVREHLDLYRAQLSPPTMADAARQYLRLLLGDAAYQS